MGEEDINKKAEDFRKSHGLGDKAIYQSSHPFVEAMREIFGNAQLLADDKNQAFTQLYLGKYRNLFTDETKDFALAYKYACEPLNEIQEELQMMGITQPERVEKTILEGGIEKKIVVYEEVPIKFEVTILKNFIDEWLRKRVPANRLRVKEFIEIIKGNQTINDIMTRPQSSTPQEPNRGRLF